MKGKTKILGTAMGVGMFLGAMHPVAIPERGAALTFEYESSVPLETSTTLPLVASKAPKKAPLKTTAPTTTPAISSSNEDSASVETQTFRQNVDKSVIPLLGSSGLKLVNIASQNTESDIATITGMGTDGTCSVTIGISPPENSTASALVITPLLAGPTDVISNPDSPDLYSNQVAHLDTGNYTNGFPVSPNDQSSVSNALDSVATALHTACADLNPNVSG